MRSLKESQYGSFIHCSVDTVREFYCFITKNFFITLSFCYWGQFRWLVGVKRRPVRSDGVLVEALPSVDFPLNLILYIPFRISTYSLLISGGASGYTQCRINVVVTFILHCVSSWSVFYLVFPSRNFSGKSRYHWTNLSQFSKYPYSSTS